MSNIFHLYHTKRKVLEEINKEISLLKITRKSYAAFDLDNTLLIGDIGESVLALLIKKGFIENFGWRDYLMLLKKNKLQAYKHIINLMQGLELSVLEEISFEVINSKHDTISLEDFKIPVPKPNPQMKLILKMLRKKGINIYVVTASNEVSARIISDKYFDISDSNVMGAEVVCDRNGIIQTSSKEFPYGIGKVNILRKSFRNKPLVTGGDSPGDKYLLEYTVRGGIRLWLGSGKLINH